MRLGILSDSHGKTDLTRQAVALLQQAGAEFFVHCGDVGGQAVLDHLAGLPSAFVWGNGDFDRGNLESYGQKLGITCLGSFGQLSFDGKTLAVLHGDDAKLKARLLADQQYDYLLQGHTHVRHEQRIGRTLLINPGALHRATPKTVALLDIAVGQVRFLTVQP